MAAREWNKVFSETRSLDGEGEEAKGDEREGKCHDVLSRPDRRDTTMGNGGTADGMTVT